MERDGDGGAQMTSDLGAKIDYFGRIPVKRGILIAISLASFFTFYDFSNFPYIAPLLKIIWHVTDTQIAYAASMTIVGQVIGASCITVFADYYGRKPAFLVTLLVLIAGSILAFRKYHPIIDI